MFRIFRREPGQFLGLTHCLGERGVVEFVDPGAPGATTERRLEVEREGIRATARGHGIAGKAEIAGGATDQAGLTFVGLGKGQDFLQECLRFDFSEQRHEKQV